MTRSEPQPPDGARTADDGTGVAVAPPGEGTNDESAAATEAVRRELARLTALLRHHFSHNGEDSLLPALANTSDPEAATSARLFLSQIRSLAESLQRDAARWSESDPAAGAFADFRRETMALLQGVEQRLGETGPEDRLRAR